ncbi:MAG: hypothetical protein ACI32C_03135 [Candidatus Enteromonas sp.]
MHPTPLTLEERTSIRPGEALSLATVIVVFTVVILTIVAYKLFSSGEAKLQLPSGFKFEWEM